MKAAEKKALKLYKHREFLDRYPTFAAYMRKEGAMLITALTLLLLGFGAAALTGGSLNIGYLILLVLICVFISSLGTFGTYHWKTAQAQKADQRAVDAIKSAQLSTGMNGQYVAQHWNHHTAQVPVQFQGQVPPQQPYNMVYPPQQQPQPQPPQQYQDHPPAYALPLPTYVVHGSENAV